ncbi:hypothetical protein C1H46_033627 [Malus baccata]|uniref:DYW domain-containing protein n=1 Tax=Malus baccata TaxID=106549 RepID=A0A540L3G1_MALBA|nr:hypothetical protein C1H46_033627 [Malus baccata]
MSMPEKPNLVRTHGDLRRGSLAFKHFTELEPMSSDRYKVAGIMFANAGENESATEIWKLIGEYELEITRGMSFIKIDGAVHEVVVWTIHHSRHKEIYMWIRVRRLLVIMKLKLELHSLLWKIAKPLKMAVLSWTCYTLDTQRGF